MISGFRRYRLNVHTETVSVPLYDFVPMGKVREAEPLEPMRFVSTEFETRRELRTTLVGARSQAWVSRQMQAECLAPPTAMSHGQGSRAAIAAVHLENDWIGCSCGIYITRTEEMGRGVDYERYPVLANVVGWGHYVEYEEGWKVQFARIESMSLRDNSSDAKLIADVLERTYQVPVHVAPRVSNCCTREHTPQLFKSRDTDVPICKLPLDELNRLYQLYRSMSLQDPKYAGRMSDEFRRELERRPPPYPAPSYLPPSFV